MNTLQPSVAGGAQLDALLSLSDVRRVLSIGDRTARRWLSCGKLPAPDFRLAGRYARWKPDTIARFLESQAVRNS